MPNEPKAISLDDLLKKQERSGKVTIDVIAGQPDRVKVTPFAGGTSGCRCHASVVVGKDLIETVTDTGEVHYCCGKSLSVVTVLWKEGASLPITDVLAEAAKRSDSGSDHQHHQQAGQPLLPGYRVPNAEFGGGGQPSSGFPWGGVPMLPRGMVVRPETLGFKLNCPNGCGCCCVGSGNPICGCCDCPCNTGSGCTTPCY